ATGALDTSTALTDISGSSNAMRGGFSTNGTDLWQTGSALGLHYAVKGGTTSTSIAAAPTNTRRVYAYTKQNSNVQLYISSQTGTTDGVSTVGSPPPPTTGGQTV